MEIRKGMPLEAIEFTWLQAILNLLTATTEPVISSPGLLQCGVKHVNLNCFQDHNQTCTFDSALVCLRNTATL